MAIGRPKKSVSAADRLAARSADPLGYLIREFEREPTWERAIELLPYQCPKLKAVEVKGDISTTITVEIGGSDGS